MTDLDFDLRRLGDALELAARRDLARRLGPSRRRRTLALVAIAFALLAGVTAAVAATVVGGPSHFEHGKLVLPAQVADEMARLNARLDACYIAHGASRVDLADGGFTYRDPQGVAQAACAPEQRAVDAYANGPEMRAASDAAAPLLRAFWTCMRRSGVFPQDQGQAVADLRSPAFRAAEDACSAEANARAGSTSP
jgi:hypothetical protein